MRKHFRYESLPHLSESCPQKNDNSGRNAVYSDLKLSPNILHCLARKCEIRLLHYVSEVMCHIMDTPVAGNMIEMAVLTLFAWFCGVFEIHVKESHTKFDTWKCSGCFADLWIESNIKTVKWMHALEGGYVFVAFMRHMFTKLDQYNRWFVESVHKIGIFLVYFFLRFKVANKETLLLVTG